MPMLTKLYLLRKTGLCCTTSDYMVIILDLGLQFWWPFGPWVHCGILLGTVNKIQIHNQPPRHMDELQLEWLEH